MRSGTENVPLIAGFAAATAYIGEDKEKNARRIAALKASLVRRMSQLYPKSILNGSAKALPHIANIWLPGKAAEDLLIRLDLAGIAVSAGSACAARSSQPSYVLKAMGCSVSRARESLRFSFGRMTAPAEMNHLFAILKQVLKSS